MEKIWTKLLHSRGKHSFIKMISLTGIQHGLLFDPRSAAIPFGDRSLPRIFRDFYLALSTLIV